MFTYSHLNAPIDQRERVLVAQLFYNNAMAQEDMITTYICREKDASYLPKTPSQLVPRLRWLRRTRRSGDECKNFRFSENYYNAVDQIVVFWLVRAMAQSESFLHAVEKEIECPVCHCPFSGSREPKMFECLHTICKSCLRDSLLLRGEIGGALRCPICWHITECPNNDIKSFPSNLFYKQLVNIFEAHSEQGQDYSQWCGNCDERKSLKFYCSDCSHFICEDCARHHEKWKLFGGHRLKEIRNLDVSDALDYARGRNACKKHYDDLRFFCEQCNTCICRDCAILEHRCHSRIMSLEEGLEKKKSEIEVKIREVQVNGSRLKDYKKSLEKRRLKVNNSFEQATKEVQDTAERCINLFRRHELESVTKRLMKQKESFEAAFATHMTSLDGKLSEVGNSLEFGEEVLFRNNLPEILSLEEMLKKRLRKLSFPFEPMLNFPEVRYTRNDMSSLTDAPGKLHTTNTEPSLSVAEGHGLTEAIQGECGTFTVITKNAKNQTTYSEIDGVVVAISSPKTGRTVKTNITDCKNGQYLVKYKSDFGGDFNVSISVRGEAIKRSPFRLTVIEKTTKGLTGSLNFVLILLCLDICAACFRAQLV